MSPPSTSPRRWLDLLFYCGVALLLCHELDAVAQSEWRLLPGLEGLTDDDAYPIFVLVHLPLLALVLWWTASICPQTRRRAQLAVDGFLVLHVGLHLLFRSHEHYTFHSALSEFCILGGGAVGLLHAVLAARQQPTGPSTATEAIR